MSSKKISQREAVRNRRDLRSLRRILHRIRGNGPAFDARIGQWNLGSATEFMRGASAAAAGNVVFLARREDSCNVSIGIVRLPEIDDVR